MTPVELLTPLSTTRCALWLKRDDLAHPLYGGNKARKLERILADARERGATRLVTIGALGSHQILATGIFGRLAGMRVDAAVLGQPLSPRVLETLRASLAQGVGLHPVRTYLQAARLTESWVADGAYAIPAGGSSELGTQGIVDAALELAAQVREGLLPEPDLVVVPLGSGGTAAGLTAGFARAGLSTRVLAVAVTEPSAVFERKARALARQLVEPALQSQLDERLQIERGYLGAGYGHETPESDAALRIGAEQGIPLEATYTAKAFAATLARVALGRERTILYWQTLSSAAMTPFLIGAPSESEIDPNLLQLARF